MFPITVTLHNPAQLRAVLAALDAPAVPDICQPAQTPAFEQAASGPTAVAASLGRVPREIKPKVEAKVEPRVEPKVEPKVEAPAPAAAPVDYDIVAKAITVFVAANGREATLAKLGELGVTSGKNLKPEQWAQALALFTVGA